jgi:hypothetical protein
MCRRRGGPLDSYARTVGQTEDGDRNVHRQRRRAGRVVAHHCQADDAHAETGILRQQAGIKLDGVVAAENTANLRCPARRHGRLIQRGRVASVVDQRERFTQIEVRGVRGAVGERVDREHGGDQSALQHFQRRTNRRPHCRLTAASPRPTQGRVTNEPSLNPSRERHDNLLQLLRTVSQPHKQRRTVALLA